MAKDSYTTGMNVADLWAKNKVYRSLLEMNLETQKGVEKMAKRIYKTKRAREMFKKGFNSQMEYLLSKKE